MGKESELYQVIRDRDVVGLHKLLKKDQRVKTKLIGSSRRLNLNAQDREGTSPLHLAAANGASEIARILIEHGAILDVKDHKGKRPLHTAIENGRSSILVTLLEGRSNPNEPSYDGKSPLHVAAWRADHSVIRLLMHFGADPTRIDHQHRTPLHVACEQGFYQVAEELIRSGFCDSVLETAPYEDMSDQNRTTCLHLAARNGHADVVRLLLDSGVDVNRQTLQGTSLHEAAQYNRIHVVKLLLEHGVDTTKLNNYHQTALDIANKQASKSPTARDIKTLLCEGNYANSVRAVKEYNLSMAEPGHLSFKEGDLIRVVEKHPNGLWKGCVIGADGHVIRNGYFPANTVMPSDVAGGRPISNYSSDSSNSDRSPIPVLSPHVPDHYSRPHLYPIGVSAQNEYDRDSGISPGQHSVSSIGAQSFSKTASHTSSAPVVVDRTAEWVKHCSVAGSDGHSPASSSRGSPSGSNRSSLASTNSGTLSNHYVTGYLPSHHQHSNTHLNGVQQNRLSRESYESGVSVSHGGSSSSLGSIERMEESGYSSHVNVGEMLRMGYQDHDVLRRWLSDLNLEEYHALFVNAGYDLPTISRMTPEDLTAIGVQKPAHRKRLKAEISRMNIHDGLPEHLPISLEEWLNHLGLMEYHSKLTSQGYRDTNKLTDITWEDLEDFNITRLGHQKKILLAVDRLRRIRNNTYHPHPRPASRQGSREHLLETAPAHSPNMRYTEFKSVHAGQRSPSSDQLAGPRLIQLDMRSFQHSLEDVQAQHSPGRITGIVHLHQPPTQQMQPDIVPIHINRPVPSSPAHHSKNASDGGTHFSFQAPPTPSSSSSNKSRHSSGDSTPTPSADEAANLRMTLRRPAARVSPLPKPKPTIGKILAKNKHLESIGSGDKLNRIAPPDIVTSAGPMSMPNYKESNRLPGYSVGTLGRKPSLGRSGSHIYDSPADSQYTVSNGPVSLHIVTTHESLATSNHSPNSSGSGSPRWLDGAKGKKAPPPPPKRSASIKNGQAGIRDGGTDLSNLNASSDQSAYTSCVQSLANRFSQPSDFHDDDDQVSRDENDSPEPEFPPPPPPLSTENYSPYETSGPANSSGIKLSSQLLGLSQVTKLNVHSPTSSKQKELDSLDSVLQELQVTSSRIPENNRPVYPKIQQKPTIHSQNVPASSADYGFDSDTSQSDAQHSDSDTESISAQCEAVLERTNSAGTIDSNTLPFANENVGTIKQRNEKAKASVISSSEEMTINGTVQRNIELNDNVFQEATATIKRNRAPASQTLSGPARESPRPMKKPAVTSPKPVVPPKTSNGPSYPNNDDVFGDIGNMLENLTSELDAMLDPEDV